MSNKNQYTVLWDLGRDGKNYTQGDPIDLTDEDAAPLLSSGVIKSAKVAIDDIVTAIDELQDSDFTSNGLPEVKALELVLDVDITAEQRDQAWELYNQ